ncbi:MAG: hypothetical protein EAZ16_01620 [Sphingobacteriales bacterium]|nr:MAG: hypothetical protein EAZ16_01620 [Sphingobacteriales bacterium]
MAVHSHNIESTRWKSLGKWWWKILWLYEKATHAAAHYNFFIHDDDKRFAVEQFNLNPAACTTVTYGIDWSERPSDDERVRCRQLLQQQYGISPEEKILLFNGALDYAPNLQAVKKIITTINPLLLQTGFAYRIIICNPVIEGGGIKTKLVEALGYGTAAVSTTNGAIGVNKEDAGDLLTITNDNDWPAFVQAIIKTQPAVLPNHFFTKFYWGYIAQKVIAFIK